jgi:S-adenosylmethionine:tRNA ribosyltransferase-isomerase
MPLPPYINRAAEEDDKTRYQTVYAQNVGAVAAPTAGLHFTDELLAAISARGAIIKKLTLHVGLGTFWPIREEAFSDITRHKMHEERYHIGEDLAEAVTACHAAGGRVFATGTTCVRALESAATAPYELKSGSGRTAIFIYPGFEFKIVDALITNFHLPKSTLIILVSAFAGRECVLNAYKEAVKEGYHFFSYGDSSLFFRAI